MTETPAMPSETYQTMLNHGAAKHIPIQAGEVAWMPRRRRRAVAAFVRVLFIVAKLALILFSGACLKQLGVF